MPSIERYILVVLVVLFIVVFGRWLKRYLRRNEIHDKFPYLFPFEKSIIDLQQIIKMELPEQARVKGEVRHLNGKIEALLFDEVFDAGEQMFAMDTTVLPNGHYELRIEFPNQLTSRNFEIKNEI